METPELKINFHIENKRDKFNKKHPIKPFYKYALLYVHPVHPVLFRNTSNSGTNEQELCISYLSG